MNKDIQKIKNSGCKDGCCQHQLHCCCGSSLSHRKKEDLKEKAVRGVKKALKEYGDVFKRLADYDK